VTRSGTQGAGGPGGPPPGAASGAPRPPARPPVAPAGSLSLFDAVNISLGSIIGAGIFVVLGAAAALSGPALVLSVVLAAAVSLLTGLATASLSRMYPRSGGVYVFTREAISDFAGFLVGWAWLFSNIIGGATVAVGFGHYLAFFFPSLPTAAGIVAVIAVTVLIQLLGAEGSSRFNNILDVVKIAVLLFFSVEAFLHFHAANFRPLMPFGVKGLWAGAATMFFAYAGFARVAVVADEIKDPRRNVPRATLLSIGISTAIYFVVAVAAVGGAGAAFLAKSGSPLADAIENMGLRFGAGLVGFGGLAATSSVLLASLWGISRLAQVMAHERDLPAFIGRAGRRSNAPRNAILLGGAAMLGLSFSSDLPHIAYISSFSVLLYYAALNLSGLKVLKGGMRVVTALGFLSCLALMFSLPKRSWIVGAAAVAAGALFHWATNAARKPGRKRPAGEGPG
jgi:APA family basic amino acid/polyamine antiporter